MPQILALLHTEENGLLPRAALETLTAAIDLNKKLDGTLTVGILGAKANAAADTLGGCGAAAFLTVENDAVAKPRYATDASAAAALIQASGAKVILAPGTSRFSRCIPGAAFRAGAQTDTHIVALSVANGEVQAQRWFYRQRILGTFTRKAGPWVLLIDGGVFAPWSGAAGSASPQAVAVAFGDEDLHTTPTGTKSASSGEQTIKPDAKLLFVAGAGWTKKQKDGQTHIDDAARLIQGFLKASGASLGSSKSVVDLQSEGQASLSFITHMNQVGQTGATPRHPKGLSTCCHGEEPHVVGWRFINERRAVNTDPNCGWAQGKADVLYVADAFEVMAKVNALLSK
jgi:electron transfer flavoprotein alpha subunit